MGIGMGTGLMNVSDTAIIHLVEDVSGLGISKRSFPMDRDCYD